MKCITMHGGQEIKRLDDADADALVSKGQAKYATKSSWKTYDQKGHKERQGITMALQKRAAERKAKEANQ